MGIWGFLVKDLSNRAGLVERKTEAFFKFKLNCLVISDHLTADEFSPFSKLLHENNS